MKLTDRNGGRFPLWVFLLPNLGFLLTWTAYLWISTR